MSRNIRRTVVIDSPRSGRLSALNENDRDGWRGDRPIIEISPVEYNAYTYDQTVTIRSKSYTKDVVRL